MLTEKQTPAIIDLPKYLDNRGNLSYIEEDTHLPFRIRRVYWIYDVPGGESRGGHAFRSTEELIVALSGSFDVVLNDGEKEYRFSLNRSYYGLYVPSMMWRLIENFSTNSLALVIASTDYSINEYIRDFNEFCRIKKNEKVGI
ncbi:MAG: TDP-4-oxo-6-deoxy-alpha-D-glucose-3,4-oxoisomerase [Bacteroidetes bacterium ADurb.Bin145]|nr:MAG: TDP-4-oxo-6-deoxy-alpha-D-glucose-3,4-oxoisomerase [Bacteroidetes bacterium ADurb.Bin145]HQM69589.1 FdtA/QdtA family cupin domain-containing protein [Bacteroidales bacterium]